MSRTKDAFIEELQKQSVTEMAEKIGDLIALGVNVEHTERYISKVIDQFLLDGDYSRAYDKLDKSPVRITVRFILPNVKNRIKIRLRRLKYKLIDNLPHMVYHASID